MSSAILLLNFVGVFISSYGYLSGCDFNQTIIAKEGSTATFLYNFTLGRYIYYRLELYKVLGSTPRNRPFIAIGIHIDRKNIVFDDYPWEISRRAKISSDHYSDDIYNIRVDLKNVSIKDDGAYRLGRNIACFRLIIVHIKTEPSSTREETEPVLVYAHPHVSLIKLALPNAEIVWLLDGETINQTASFIQQDGFIWIASVGRRLDGKNVTYRLLHDDGRIIEVNATLNVKYGPSNPLQLVPRKKHHFLVSGDILPDITCTSECNPPCNISWGKYSNSRTLSLGAVTTEDTGEYTCTATRAGGQVVEQTISIYVAGNSYFIEVMTCFGSVQALTIFVLGMFMYFVCKRKLSSCYHKHHDSKKKQSGDALSTFSEPAVRVSENENYEQLRDGSRNMNNTYSELT